jgi:tripartite-type tricarboxylate transporter receptor subunit TctC
VYMSDRIKMLILSTLCLVAVNGAAHAAWPKDRPIQFLVGFAAGGGQDIMFRTLQPYIEQELGARLVIVNRPGATGEFAYTAMSQATPDGYTFSGMSVPGFITSSIARKVRYDPKALVPVARLVVDPTTLVVHATSSFKSLKDVVAFAKANPRKVSLGGSGIGTDEHFAVLLLKRLAGVDLTYVPFTGTSEATTALLGDHITLVGSSVSGHASLGLSDSGRGGIRPIAQLAKQRNLAPQIPTAKEQGYDLVLGAERGVITHAKVPADIRKRFEAAIKATLENPKFQEAARTLNLPLQFLSGAEWAAQLEEQRRTYQAMWEATPWVQK